MRNAEDVYWSASLPREHRALQTLDAYCLEWGGLSRSEATRRLLIEWDKLRRGESMMAWAPQHPSQPSASPSPQWSQQTAGIANKQLNRVARVASQVLDD